MIDTGDFADIVLDALRRETAAGAPKPQSRPADYRAALRAPAPRAGKWGATLDKTYNAPYTSLPAKRIFLSEHEIKKMAAALGAQPLLVPKSSILSPLAEDWLQARSIRIERV